MEKLSRRRRAGDEGREYYNSQSNIIEGKSLSRDSREYEYRSKKSRIGCVAIYCATVFFLLVM